MSALDLDQASEPMDENAPPSITAPPKRRRWTALRMTLFFTVCGLFAWTMLVSQFVSSPFGQSIALAVAIGMGLLTAYGTWFDPTFADDTPERAEMIARRPFMKDRGPRTFFMTVLAAPITFMAVNGAGLEFWTITMGHPDQWSLHLGDYRTASRGNCAGFTLEEAPFALHRIICVDYPYGESPAEPGTPVTVWGRASDVGIRVERFEIGPS